MASTGGSIDPGQIVVVGFEVDPSQLGPGSNPILNCITYEGGAVDLWITVTKPGPLPTIRPSFTG